VQTKEGCYQYEKHQTAIMTRKTRQRIVKVFAVIAIVGMVLSMLAGGLLTLL